MPPEPTDIQLMQRLAAGDRDALAALIGRHQKSLVNFFRRMGARTMEECEDLSQETFLRLYAYRERYRPTGAFRNLLFVMARHAWADFARKAARGPGFTADEGIDAPAPPGPDPDAKLDVRQALGALSEKLRMVVVLNVYQGLSYQEVADVLEVPLGTVKSRMHLALRQLRDEIDGNE